MSYLKLDKTIEDMVESKKDTAAILLKFKEIHCTKVSYESDLWMVLLSTAILFEHRPLWFDLLNSEFLQRHIGHDISPVLTAIENDDPELFELLVRHGADIHKTRGLLQSDGSWRPGVIRGNALTAVIKRDDVGWLRLLLPYYIPERSEGKITPLHLACCHNSPKCFDFLLSLPDISGSINAPDAHGRTPLLRLVTQRGSTADIKALLEHGADPCVADTLALSYYNITVFTELVKSHSLNASFIDKAQLLIDAGAEVSAEGRYGGNALESLLHEFQTNTLVAPVIQRYDFDWEFISADHVDSRLVWIRNAFLPNAWFLLQNADIGLVSEFMADLTSCYNSMICRPLSFPGEEDEIRIFFDALPRFLAVVKDTIEVCLSLGADTNRVGKTRPHGNSAETLIHTAKTVHSSVFIKFEGDSYNVVSDHLLEVLKLILRYGHTEIHHKYMYSLLSADVQCYRAFLGEYLDSVPLVAQHQYIEELLQMADESDGEKDLNATLISYRETMLSLRYQCRYCILSAVGMSDGNIEQLPLPRSIREYISTFA